MINLIPAVASTQNLELQELLTTKINNKTKPLGSLGKLENIALQIGLIQGSTTINLCDPEIFVFAADHGVTEENISAFPQEVTWQMVQNFIAGGAAINVFARQNHINLRVVDCGVKHEFSPHPMLLDRKLAWGSENFSKAPAMSQDTLKLAIKNGRELLRFAKGNVVGLGEMGIGNTTAAAALMHAITGQPAAACVGAGTGLNSAGIEHKQQVIQQARRLHESQSTLEILRCLGGLEIATMVGFILEAAAQRKVILIDGFIVTSALLVAASLQPHVIDYCIFSHQSGESGHAKMLEFLKVKSVLQLELRLGEGTGAALVYPIVLAAVNFFQHMASFDSANVSEKIEHS